MLRLDRTLGVGFLVRGLIKELRRIGDGLEAQNRLLARLADEFAPETPKADLAVTSRDSGIDYLDPVEAALVTEYVDRCTAELGHVPTEEQILRYLADQKTTSLQARLSLRDEDLARLSSTRGEG